MDSREIGRQLRALRLRAGLTQAEVVRRAGMTNVYLSFAEAGKYDVPIRTIRRLACAMGYEARVRIEFRPKKDTSTRGA